MMMSMPMILLQVMLNHNRHNLIHLQVILHNYAIPTLTTTTKVHVLNPLQVGEVHASNTFGMLITLLELGDDPGLEINYVLGREKPLFPLEVENKLKNRFKKDKSLQKHATTASNMPWQSRQV